MAKTTKVITTPVTSAEHIASAKAELKRLIAESKVIATQATATRKELAAERKATLAVSVERIASEKAARIIRRESRTVRVTARKELAAERKFNQRLRSAAYAEVREIALQNRTKRTEQVEANRFARETKNVAKFTAQAAKIEKQTAKVVAKSAKLAIKAEALLAFAKTKADKSVA
jgi:hypothetical protein